MCARYPKLNKNKVKQSSKLWITFECTPGSKPGTLIEHVSVLLLLANMRTPEILHEIEPGGSSKTTGGILQYVASFWEKERTPWLDFCFSTKSA